MGSPWLGLDVDVDVDGRGWFREEWLKTTPPRA